MASALVAAAVGQSGQVPIPARYATPEAATYRRVAAEARAAASSADVIVLGNSRLMNGVDPHLLASTLRLSGVGHRPPRVVNLAAMGGMSATNLWLWRELCRGPHPPQARLLVVGVTELDFPPTYPGIDYSLRYLFRVTDAPWLLVSGQYDKAATMLAYRAFPLYANSPSMRNMLTMRLGPTAEQIDRWARAHKLWPALNAMELYRHYQTQPFQIRCLTQLVHDAKGRGMEVVLVAAPVDMALLRVMTGRPLPLGVGGRRAESYATPDRNRAPLYAFKRVVSNCARREGVPFLDYMTREDAGRFDYLDVSHLSRKGAAQFTPDLAMRINRYLARTPQRSAATAQTDSNPDPRKYARLGQIAGETGGREPDDPRVTFDVADFYGERLRSPAPRW